MSDLQRELSNMETERNNERRRADDAESTIGTALDILSESGVYVEGEGDLIMCITVLADQRDVAVVELEKFKTTLRTTLAKFTEGEQKSLLEEMGL